MNNSMIIGRYYQSNSIIHKLDPRTKLLALIVLIVAMFLIPYETNIPYLSFILMGAFVLLLIILMILSKIPLINFIRSYKGIFFLVMFSLVIQALFNKGSDTTPLFELEFNFTLVNILISVVVLILFMILSKFLKLKTLILLVLAVGIIVLCHYAIYPKPFVFSFDVPLYKHGLVFGAYTVIRVILIISFSTVLTLTTKPIELSNAIEWYLKPLELIKIKTSIFAMMLSIALRFIPTLYQETEKILKAQASRGVDFKENSLGKQIIQIISLLIPMFVISIKRASDLADAMEARGYIPGEKRTKFTKMHFKAFDYISIIFVIAILALSITGRVFL